MWSRLQEFMSENVEDDGGGVEEDIDDYSDEEF